MDPDGNEKEMLPLFSFITPLGYQAGSCGYCKDSDSSGSYYATSSSLTAEHYQTLIDRSWRRSGDTLYKPDQLRSCCTHYTIRLPVAEFHASRDQRQSLHKFNRFVLGEAYIKEATRQRPKAKSEKKAAQHKFDLVSTVHEAEYSILHKISVEPDHRFEVSLETTDFSEEKYALYEQYQRNIHKETNSTRSGFRSFLCKSPIETTVREVEGKSQRLGSFHQCYRLDGKLIAIGVLDLLPHAVSSVYFIYNTNYEKFGFGKLSALREAALALEDGYDYYYMGYYIHSCLKMRYKNDYKPQYILDPDTYQWDPLNMDVKAKLDTCKFVSLSRDRARRSLPDDKGEESRTVAHGSSGEAAGLSPLQAARSGRSLFELQMPGLLTLRDLEGFDMGSMGVKLSDEIHHLHDLVGWSKGGPRVKGTLQNVIAHLVACLGLSVARRTIIDFSDGG